MKFKILSNRLKKNTKDIFNKNDRLATTVVNPVPVSKFDQSFRHLTTFNSGKLVPIFCREMYPGDVVDIDVKMLLRLSTPQAATMDNPVYDVAFYFVPWRILWKEWKNLMGESKTAGFQKDVENVPLMDYSPQTSAITDGFKYTENDLAAYLGFPINVNMSNIGVPISALWFKAYGQIWNDFYRDQNLQSEIDITNNNNNDANVVVNNYTGSATGSDISGPGNLWPSGIQTGFGLAPTSRLADYFSTALPWPQKGDSVTIDTLSLSNVLISGHIVNNPDSQDINGLPVQTQYAFQPQLFSKTSSTTKGTLFAGTSTGTPSGDYSSFNAKFGATSVDLSTADNLYMDLALDPNSTSIAYANNSTNYSINDLRLALAIQHIREKDARGGTRYIEFLLNHFGVSATDARLDRSEYIGGWRDSVSMNNIVQASNGNAASPLGTIGGVSVTYGVNKDHISYACEEHGCVIGVITIRSNISYSQGLDKQFTRTERLDFYLPELANIGEQPIKKFELFLEGTPNNNNNDVFGYNEAWADLRWTKNILSGYCSVNSTLSIASLYTYTQKYDSTPTLTGDWMIYDGSIIRDTLTLNNNQVEFVNEFIGDFYFDYKIQRKMPAFSIPGLKRV